MFSRNQGEPSCQSQVLEARPLDHIAHPAVPATPRRRRQIIDAVPSGLRNGRLVVRTAHVTQPHASSSRSDPQSDGLDSRPTKNRWSQRAEGPETTLLKLKAHCLCFLQIADFTSRGSRSLLDSLNTAPSLRPCNPPACSAHGTPSGRENSVFTEGHLCRVKQQLLWPQTNLQSFERKREFACKIKRIPPVPRYIAH